jgi:ADP-ribose pyrophosphatase YjhB (NUDIX family)
MVGSARPEQGTLPGGTARAFSRFRADPPASGGYWPVPADGLCLSLFVLASRAEERDAFLVGRIDPAADWAMLGAMDAQRAATAAKGWMLPASHLLQYESPEEAAGRVLHEQLGLPAGPPGRLAVFSETYQSRNHLEQHRHWDLHFLRFATPPAGWRPQHPAWRELRYVRPGELARKEFARSHDEILELAGFRFP